MQKISGAIMLGTGSQSQYNGWLDRNVLVMVDEMCNSNSNFHWQRHEASELLKNHIDPMEREVEIIRKGMNNYKTTTYASFLMATNNSNALPLSDDDRRICVLRNGVPMIENPMVAAALERYRDGGGFTAGFAAAVAQLLHERNVDHYDPYAVPPMFEGKRHMIDTNVTEGTAAALDALNELPGDCVTNNAFINRVRARMEDHSYKNLRPDAKAVLNKAWIYIGRRRVKVNNTQAEVWCRTDVAATTFLAASLADREKLLAKNNGVEVISDTQRKALGTGLLLVNSDDTVDE